MIVVTYKTKKISDGMVQIPFYDKDSAIKKAKFLYKKGYLGVKVSEITEKIIYIPVQEQEFEMDILEKAIEKYGEKQLDQAQEELAELIVAISKYKRNENKFTISNVIEEIADVNIMIKQVMMLLDIKEFEVKSEEIYKLNRLKKRMLKDEPVQNI